MTSVEEPGWAVVADRADEASDTEDTGILREPAGEHTDALVVYNVLRTHASLAPYVNRGLRDLNLTAAQLNALLALRDAGEAGLPLSEIGRRLVVTKANVTGLVDRLERAGLVQRAAHPDRRITLARITARGAAVLADALPHHRRLLSELLACLTPPEKEQLISLLTRLRRGLRQHGGEAPGAAASEPEAPDALEMGVS